MLLDIEKLNCKKKDLLQNNGILEMNNSKNMKTYFGI